MAQKTRKDTEYTWYATRSSVSYPTNPTLADMKRIYWAKTVGADINKVTATDLEWRWLKTLTGVTGKTIPDMWREAVVGAGGKAENDIEANRFIYYTIVP